MPARFVCTGLVVVLLGAACSSGKPIEVTRERHRGGASVTPSAPADDESRFWDAFGPDLPVGLASDAGQIFASGQRGEVVAFDRDDPVERFRTVLSAGRVVFRPAITKSAVAVAGTAGVAAADRRSGDPRWSVPLPAAGPIVAVPDLDMFFVLVAEPGALVALDAVTGSTRWSMPIPADAHRTAAIAVEGATLVVVNAGSDGSHIDAVDAATGNKLWGAPISGVASSPATHGDRVVIAHGDEHGGSVQMLDLHSGHELWSVELAAAVSTAMKPAVDGRNVAVLDRAGTLTMLDAKTGGVQWRRELREDVGVIALRLTPKRLLFPTLAGLGVFDRRTGHSDVDRHVYGYLHDIDVLDDTTVRLLGVAGSSAVDLRPA